MLFKKEGVQIDELILDDKDAYIITYKDSFFWTLDVSRISGLINFAKGGILPESVDKFEANYDGKKTEIYLSTTDSYGSHKAYAGETEDHQAALYWVRKVNELYEELRTRQQLAEAAD